ncbi:MAG TPA: GNAT family N-acetyltransferase [Dehalococcoidia bacterium]|nr:GNAT family N-acetyltransferase [Dehalococcoidia bacterium]
MHGSVVVRDVREGDLSALAAMDLRYNASPVLHLDREQGGAEQRFAFSWRERPAEPVVYAAYPVERLRDAMPRVDAFFVAEVAGVPAGLLMIVKPAWTDACEITDLAVDARCRRSGAGSALVERAIAFARERGMRALWVEPRGDNAAAIEFYLALGFRLSGFNDRMYSNEDDADGRLTLFMYREVGP